MTADTTLYRGNFEHGVSAPAECWSCGFPVFDAQLLDCFRCSTALDDLWTYRRALDWITAYAERLCPVLSLRRELEAL